MFIISVTAYADFDIPYEVNVVALKNKEDADKLTMILNTFCAELSKKDEDVRLIKYLRNIGSPTKRVVQTDDMKQMFEFYQ